MNNPRRRWYDTEGKASEVFDRLQNLDEETKNALSVNLSDIVKQIKDLHKEELEPDLSLGLERVIGLYHQFQSRRRWYDRNDEDIAYAIKTLFTLPTQDFYNIVEGLALSLG